MAYTTDECVWVTYDKRRTDSIYFRDQKPTSEFIYVSPLQPGLSLTYCFEKPSDSPYPYREVDYLMSPKLKRTYAFFIPKQYIVECFAKMYPDDHFRFFVCKSCAEDNMFDLYVLLTPSMPGYHSIDPITRVKFEGNKK